MSGLAGLALMGGVVSFALFQLKCVSALYFVEMLHPGDWLIYIYFTIVLHLCAFCSSSDFKSNEADNLQTQEFKTG